MSRNNQQNGGTLSSGKWTVMVYMASDDANSPLFVDQVKAMTDAGYHPNVEVLVYFDPHEPGVPTSLFNVNHKRKQEHPNQVQVGDGEDSYVRDLARDIIAASNLPGTLRGDEAQAARSFASFLDYCLRTEADHYVLVVVGHGLIVGNDAFLPDENPKSGITLIGLEKILRDRFGPGKATLELLALHSCAMAAIEVVYQLKDTARYMIASEGLAFVMGWQYRQLLKRLFKGLERGETVEWMVERLYWLTYFSARDFLLAGYPLELTLCTPDGAKVEEFTKSFRTLVRHLREGLADGEAIDAIQLAHLKSQSYFGEEYTDLYDFCLCLADKCNADHLAALREACNDMVERLKPISDKDDPAKRPENLIVHSRHWGWSTQYSHGLSIYFPWSEPVKRNGNTGMKSYKDYAFTEALGDDSWWNFLTDYFRVTQRGTRTHEEGGHPSPFFDLTDFNKDFDRADFDGFLQALEDATFREKPTGGLEKPTGGSEKPTGGSSDCDCPWIKNYPRKWWT